MKVLHIIDSGGFYGAEAVLLNLVEEQLKLGIAAEIASIGAAGQGEKPLEAAARKRHLPVKAFRMLPGPNPAGMLRVLRYARRAGNGILHSHGYKANVAFGLMPRGLRQIPMVSTLHGYTSTGGISKNLIYEVLDRISLRFIDRVVLVNRGMLNNPSLRGIRHRRFDIVNNGIPTDLPDASRNDAAVNDEIVAFCKEGMVIGSIGRLSSEKGYDTLIEACAALRRQGLKVKVLIIGEGGQRRRLEEWIERLELRDAAMLPGYQERADRYMPHLSGYAISSHTEGLPMTLLEAMAAGVPVAATRVGGIPEVLDNGRCGMLVSAGDAGQLAEALKRILDNPAYGRQLAAAARRRVLANYSSRAMALSYLDIYKGLLASPKQDLSRPEPLNLEPSSPTQNP